MPSRALGATVLLPLALISALLGLTAPAADAAVGPNTSWSMRSDDGDFILGGKDYSYASGIQITGTSTRIEGSVGPWNLSVEPTDGDTLRAGQTYAGATRYPFNYSYEPGLSLYGDGRGCNTLTGKFAIGEISFDTGGNVDSLILTFEQHCEGGAPAAYGSIAWHASGPAPALPPKLTTGLDKTKVAYGKKVAVQAQLSADSPVRTLSVYTRTQDGQEKLVGTGIVDATGRLVMRVKVRETTSIVVRLQGGSIVPDREATATVQVSGKLRSAFIDKARKQGKYRLYPLSRDAKVGSVLQPDHAGDCIQFRIQLQARTGGWGYDAMSRCLKLNKNSAVGLRVTSDPRIVGVPIRVRSEWQGDGRNTAAKGKWLYLKFVR